MKALNGINGRFKVNPVVPDAHYSERQDKPFSLQIQQLEVDLKRNRGFFSFCTPGTSGLNWRIFTFAPRHSRVKCPPFPRRRRQAERG